MNKNIKSININQYEQACKYLLQMFADGMISFEDYTTQLDKLGNYYLKKVDAPNIFTTMLTSIVKGNGEEVLIATTEESPKPFTRKEFLTYWETLQNEWVDNFIIR